MREGAVPLALQLGATKRVLYLRAEKSDTQRDPALLVAGIPAALDKHSLQEAFSILGAVSKVLEHPDQTTALVHFKKVSGIQRALNTAAQGKALELQLTEPTEAFGLKGWVEEHKAATPGNNALQMQLDSWTDAFEAADAARQEAVGKAAAKDGWTLVTRTRGRKKISDATGTSVGGVATAAAQAKLAAKPDKAVTDFYRFQQRDKHRNELATLREQFEADKRKVAELRASRRFKPY